MELATALDRPAVVPLVRYYGCMPCQAYLRDLEDAQPEPGRVGLRMVGIGGAAATSPGI